jgi:hypothetical protein
MSVTIELQTRSGQNPPMWFTRTDSVSLAYHLGELYWKSSASELLKIQDHLGLDLMPLSKMASEEEPLESYLSRDPTPEREEHWHKMHEEYEAAWQNPRELYELVKDLIESLSADDSMYETLGITDDYFLRGFFEHDIKDLCAMLKWAIEEKIESVRLYTG